MPHFAWKFFPVLLFLSFCTNKQETDNQFVVKIGQASLREEPSEKSRELALLKIGQDLIDLGEVSHTESQIVLGDQLFQSPWLRVQLKNKQSGWVFAAALKPVENGNDWMLQKRMECYFGKQLSARRNALIQAFENTETDAQLCRLWRESKVLRDTFLSMVLARPKTEARLNFEWLETVLPAYLFQTVGINGGWHLFANLNFWHQKSLSTKGLQDDFFFKTCLEVFPIDSIESFYPVWKFQISDSESASQLGLGKHVTILRQIDLAMESGTTFAPELGSFRDQILEDIFGKNVRYWQSRDKILTELNQLIAAAPKCLNSRDLESLIIRKTMFEDPVKNGIVVNLRSGE